MNTKIGFLLSTLAAVSLFLSGCGRSETPAPAATAAPAGDSVRAIEITGNDAMKFSITEIRATPGEKLRITLKNIGRMPKQAMAHNWVLLTPMSDADANAFGMAAATKAPAYLPDDRSAVLAHTKMLGGGESDTIELTAPSAPGTYPFLCTFPGHFAIMKGKLIVQ